MKFRWTLIAGLALMTSCGKVKDRAEEDEVLPSHKRHPFRPVGFDEREVEHVYHLAIEPV